MGDRGLVGTGKGVFRGTREEVGGKGGLKGSGSRAVGVPIWAEMEALMMSLMISGVK